MSSLPPPLAPQPPTGAARRPRGRGPGVVLPALLIVAGVLALLVNFGYLTADQLLRAFNLWPLGLIFLGLVLIFRVWLPRLAVALALVLALVLIGGAIAYSAFPGFQVATAKSDYSAPLGKVEQGRLHLGLGATDVALRGADMPDLYRAHVEYPSGRPPKVRAESGTVSLETNNNFTLIGVRTTNRAQVSINQTVPWQVEVGGGASRQTLDLASIRLTGLDVSGGASQADATLPRPSGTVRVHISGGASNITVHRPSGVAARVRMSGGASNLTVDGTKHSVLSGEINWQTSDYDSAGDRYDFQISGGASNVTLDQR